LISEEITQVVINCRNDGLDFETIANKIEQKYYETYPAAMLERLYEQEKDNPQYNKAAKPVLSEKDLEEFFEWKAWKDQRDKNRG
jgi:hypothetical protein